MVVVATEADELEYEQTYFDEAFECREDKRARRNSGFLAAGDAKARAAMKRNADSDATLGRVDDEVAFQKLHLSDGEEVYVGKHAILNDEKDFLVYPWQSTWVMKLREATPENPGQVAMRRDFTTAGNQILSFDDAHFAEIAAQLRELDSEEPDGVSDGFLATALGRDRTPEMTAIVQTIQASQSRLIRSPADALLVIQGGPGTGKTAVALHRVSWLLFNPESNLEPSDILVVGPNATFTRYISKVLPELGDRYVPQVDLVSMLEVGVKASRKETTQVAALKGDGRMADVIAQAVHDRFRAPRETSSFSVKRFPRRVALEPTEVTTLQSSVRHLPYNEGRQRFRSSVTDALEAKVTRAFRDAGMALLEAPNDLLESTEIDSLVERVWPSVTPTSLLRELFGSLERLVSAGRGLLSADEATLLRRSPTPRISEEQWSKEDLFLLDAAADEISGELAGYKHIVVDEAQDLSPMQLRSINRRSETGAMTLVGDVAQSTGPWARDNWESVNDVLQRGRVPVVSESLLHGYRVPRSVMDLAAKLLPVAAPGIEPPSVVRDVDEGPELVAVPASGDFFAAITTRIQAHSSKGRFIGVVVPDAHKDALAAHLDDHQIEWTNASEGALGTAINLVSPVGAKGLEFDSVIVVDPDLIVQAGPQGYRMLYIALTRTTHYLDLVYREGSLPAVLDPNALDEATSSSTIGPTPSPTDDGIDSPASRTNEELTVLPAPSSTRAELELPTSERALTGHSARRQRRIMDSATYLAEELSDIDESLWSAVLDEALRLARGRKQGPK